MKKVNITLPQFAFLDTHVSDTGDELEGRNVILHIPSMSIIEIFDREDVILKDNVLTHKFGYINSYNIKEPMIAALHVCTTLSPQEDADAIKANIMIPACQWFCRYQEWEDKNMEDGLY